MTDQFPLGHQSGRLELDDALLPATEELTDLPDDREHSGLAVYFSGDKFVFSESICTHIGAPFMMYSVSL